MIINRNLDTVYLFSIGFLITGSNSFLKCMFISCKRFLRLFVLTALTCSSCCKSFILLCDSSFARHIHSALMSVSSLSLRSLSFTLSECTPHTLITINISSSNVSNLQFLDMIFYVSNILVNGFRFPFDPYMKSMSSHSYIFSWSTVFFKLLQ